MLKVIPMVIVLATACFAQSVANDETQVWSLEKAYSECGGMSAPPNAEGKWSLIAGHSSQITSHYA